MSMNPAKTLPAKTRIVLREHVSFRHGVPRDRERGHGNVLAVQVLALISGGIRCSGTPIHRKSRCHGGVFRSGHAPRCEAGRHACNPARLQSRRCLSRTTGSGHLPQSIEVRPAKPAAAIGLAIDTLLVHLTELFQALPAFLLVISHCCHRPALDARHRAGGRRGFIAHGRCGWRTSSIAKLLTGLGSGVMKPARATAAMRSAWSAPCRSVRMSR